MKKYRCIKPIALDFYDEDGGYAERQLLVNIGDIYEYDEKSPDPLEIACEPAVHLHSARSGERDWIEIYPDTLTEHFEEMKAGL